MSATAAAPALLPVERGASRTVLALAWPAILENAMHTLLGIVDTALVARLGNEAVAGVGAGAQWYFLFISVLFGFATGAVVLVARAVGAQDPAEAGRAARQGMLLALGVGLVFTVLGWLLAGPAMALLGADGEVAAIGASFLRIVALGGTTTAVGLVAGSVLRAAGDTRTPMVSTAVANVVNAVVAYVLIFGYFGLPALGTNGSAWGLNVARVVGLAILLVVLRRGRGPLRLGRRGWAPDWSALARIARIGMPSVLEQVALMLSFMAYAMIAIGLGTVAFATQRITFNALMISILPGVGFAIAATTLTGQALGAGRPDLADRTAWVAVRMAALWMGAMAVVFLLAGEPTLRLFTQDPEVLALGVPSLAVIAISSPIWSIPITLSGALRGAGDTRFPLYVTLVNGWLIRVPLGYLFGVTLGFGLVGVYAATIADALVGTAMTVWRHRRGAWRTLRV